MATDYIFYLRAFFVYFAWWVLPILFIFIYKKRLAKYPIDVVIYEKRGEHIIKTNDVAGRFSNPINCYKLKMSKDSIPIPQYDWVLQCSHKPTNLFEKFASMLSGRIGSITLFKYSSKQYKPIKVKMPTGQFRTAFREVKDNKGQPMWVQVYEPLNVNSSMSKLDFEVIDWDDINHMTQELRAIALRRSPVADFITKYGPIAALALAVVALIIAGYYYKEMVIDAGNKLMAANGKAAAAAPTDNSNINKGGGIPVVGDLFKS